MQQLQRAGEEREAWEERVLSAYPEDEAETILDLHTHVMNVHNGFGSVSRLNSTELSSTELR